MRVTQHPITYLTNVIQKPVCISMVIHVYIESQSKNIQDKNNHTIYITQYT